LSFDAAIIGAGPYGLSLAAHLRAASVDFRIFGEPMEAWWRHMPRGMLLKSYPWSSSLYDPLSSFPLCQFCAQHGIDYHDSLMPLPLQIFVAYGEEFQRRLVPDVERKRLCRLAHAGGDFQLRFDDGSELAAKRVVLAVGVYPFRRFPSELVRLPVGLMSHSGDHGQLDAFAGREVAILGSGASATDLAGLLDEQGAAVSLIARAPVLNFASAPRRITTPTRRLLSQARMLLSPRSGIGAGWALKTWADAPWAFHALPESRRRCIVETTLGPLGHAAMKDRVGKLPLLLGHSIESAIENQGKVELRLIAKDGARHTLRADHLIAATGYKIDLGRLDFLDPGLLALIAMSDGAPALSRDYESSVPGLYVIGPAAALSFGPVNRFVFGAVHPARRLARVLATARPARLPGGAALRAPGLAAS
jgi:cation diffusion facilitator CzcD-associated flavoprotein CzcO